MFEDGSLAGRVADRSDATVADGEVATVYVAVHFAHLALQVETVLDASATHAAELLLERADVDEGVCLRLHQKELFDAANKQDKHQTDLFHLCQIFH